MQPRPAFGFQHLPHILYPRLVRILLSGMVGLAVERPLLLFARPAHLLLLTTSRLLSHSQTSVSGMIGVLESGVELQGTWHAYDGQVIPW